MVKLGRYELVRRIGIGGMAEVYLARRRSAGGIEKRLVVKRIRPERAADPRFRQLFVREAELSMSLAHKNIVPMFDFGRTGDALFLVMELVDGPNLGQALARARARGGAVEPAVVAHIAFEACQALDYAHRARDPRGKPRAIAHRDVTPANVLLSFSGEVKLADFGVAAAVLEAGDGHVRGTPGYMAPEQARGEPADPRADLYALGLVLWEALTGQRARPGSQAEQLAAARAGTPPPPAEGIAAPLAEVIARATAVDPAERYADAAAMAAALDAYLLAARTADAADPTPLGRRLAAWLGALYPDGLPLLTGTSPPPAGSVATFLEDGADAVIGTQTMQSMAATVAEGATADTGDADAGTSAEETAPPVEDAAPRRRGLAGAAAAAAVGALALLAWWASATDDGEPNERGGDIPAVAAAAPQPEPRPAIEAAAPADAAPPPAIEAAAPADAASPPGAVAAAKSAEPAPRRPRAERRRSAAATAARGTLQISTRPWATVRVIGRRERCAETPCRLSLPPGRYQLELENPIAGLRRRVAVEVAADTTTVIDELLSGRGRP